MKKLSISERFLDRIFIVVIPIVLLVVAVTGIVLHTKTSDLKLSVTEVSKTPSATNSNYLANISRLQTASLDFLVTEANLNAEISDYQAFLTLRETLFQATQSLPPSSCLVVKEGERELFTHNATIGLIPASGQKLLLALAALLILGEDYTFTTEVRSFLEPVDGKLEGDLYFIGSGDPFLWTKDFYEYQEGAKDGLVYTSLDDLGEQIINQGITSITGSVIAVESHFDSLRYPPSWSIGLRNQSVSGALSALMVNRGLRLVEPTEEDITEEDTAEEDISEEENEETSEPIWKVAYLESAKSAAAELDDYLEAKGVRIPFSPIFSSSVPSNILASIQSPPLKDLLRNILRISDNAASELILKEIGVQTSGEGSTEAGIDAVVDKLISVGIYSEKPKTLPSDGSGVSNANRSSCQELIKVLEYKDQGSLINSLSISGQSGTLINFLPNSEVAGKISAKTGTLEGVASLTGFVSSTGFSASNTETSRMLTFSYISNDTLSSDLSLKERANLEEKIAMAMLNYLS